MKKSIGFLILLIVLIGVCGCTQQAKTTTATTTAATEIPTPEATTVEVTAVPTPMETTVEATPVATNSPEATVTAAPVSENTTVAPTTTTVLITASMTPSTKVTVVHIANNTFTPAVLMVLPGTSISWVNDDNKVHSVKMIEGHKFNSGDIIKGGQWSYSFGATEGTFQYIDGSNTNVTGVIIVKKGESFAGMGTPSTYVTSNATW